MSGTDPEPKPVSYQACATKLTIQWVTGGPDVVAYCRKPLTSRRATRHTRDELNHPHGEGAKVCEAQERNEQAAYELRGMAQQWQLDIPRILQILTGTDCQHQTTNG